MLFTFLHEHHIIFLNRNFNGTMSRISLKDTDTRAPKQFDKEKTKKDTGEILEELDELQERVDFLERRLASPETRTELPRHRTPT